MEFVILTFPTTRAARRDGRPFGTTGTKQDVEAGTHRFDLGPNVDYTPAFIEQTVIGTSFEFPMMIDFFPLAPLAEAPGVEAEAPAPPAMPIPSRVPKKKKKRKKKAKATKRPAKKTKRAKKAKRLTKARTSSRKSSRKKARVTRRPSKKRTVARKTTRRRRK
jgi:hypothetical protein